MGVGFSHLFPCLNPAVNHRRKGDHHHHHQDAGFTASEDDETLGHSFCYVPSSARFVSPTDSDRFVSPSQSLRFDSSAEPVVEKSRQGGQHDTTVIRAISGASVSANSSVSRTVMQMDKFYEDASVSEGSFSCSTASCGGVKGSVINGFESTSSFRALPLQPAPRGGCGGGSYASAQMERTFFLSGPIESGALSGPLDMNGGPDGSNGVPFSAPLGGMYAKKRRRRSLSGIPKALRRSFSEKKRPWVVPERSLVNRLKEACGGASADLDLLHQSKVQWALGKAGEDRVHVVVSEEHGWLFVGIYDGFNGPDAPEFLMSNLYKATYKELEGLFWDSEDTSSSTLEVPESAQNSAAIENSALPMSNQSAEGGQVGIRELQCDQSAEGGQGDIRKLQCEEGRVGEVKEVPSVGARSGEDIDIQTVEDRVEGVREIEEDTTESCLDEPNKPIVKKVTFESGEIEVKRRRLWELLAEDDPQDGLDLSGSDRFAFSVDDAISVSNAGPGLSKKSLLLSKLKRGLSMKRKESRSLFPWKVGVPEKEKTEVEVEGSKVEEEKSTRDGRRAKGGPVNPNLVLRAMARALEVTELAYLDLTDKVLDRHPEIALMGSCLLVVLMRDEDVYVMNLGDSRAIVAQYEPVEATTMTEVDVKGDSVSNTDIVDESANAGGRTNKLTSEASIETLKLKALQLSTDHSTSIEEEVNRIKKEHPDDSNCIRNDRVKGRLKVTRAFGAGFLKQPKWNDVLLEMFRNEYIGTAPYLSCIPSLCHHKLCPSDQFLVLSSDGLYQYFSNQQVVSFVENFMEKFPEGDPAQHLLEELLVRAARKAGMDFHELLNVPQGDRRQYHDDVTVMVISLEGRIWKSSGKYP